MVKLGEINPTIWDVITEKMEEQLKEFKFKAEDIVVDWRISAASRKLERELFEQYGPWKDIILHPSFQYYKQIVEDNVDFQFQQGQPLIPMATAIIILFMMYKRINNNVLALIAGLIFNINPFYVFLTLITWHYRSQIIKPKHYIKKKPKLDLKSTNVSTDSYGKIRITPKKFYQKQIIEDGDFDHVLIGNDVSTLYCAALLSKSGHRCAVLFPRGARPLIASPTGSPCPVPLVMLNAGKVDKYQHLLDVALVSTAPRGRAQRVHFLPVGSETNGYMCAVIKQILAPSSMPTIAKHSFPGVLSTGGDSIHSVPIGSEADSINAAEQSQAARAKTLARLQRMRREKLWPVRAGKSSVSSDLALWTLLDKAHVSAVFATIVSTQQLLYNYLFTKVLPAPLDAVAVQKKDSDTHSAKALVDLAKNSILSVVSTGLRHEDAYSPLAALASMAAEEGVSGLDCSSFCLASALNHLDGGIFSPVGGVEKVIQSLMVTVQSYGGVVYDDVPVHSIVVREDASKIMRATGVKLSTSTAPPVSVMANDETTDGDEDFDVMYANKSVVSGVGALCTYINLLPDICVDQTTRLALSHLFEMKPKIHVVYWLEGTREQLKLSDAVYFETLRQDVGDTLSTAKKDASRVFCRVWSPSASDSHDWTERHGPNLQSVVVELEAQTPMVTPTQHKFTRLFHTQLASSNDSADADSASLEMGVGPIVYDASKATPESDPNRVSRVGYTIRLSPEQLESTRARADHKLLDVYPQARGRVLHHAVIPPSLGGHNISNTIDKYSFSLSATTNIQGLYLCGRDVATFGFAGDVQGGWVAANAALGYTGAELSLGRNVVADLAFV